MTLPKGEIDGDLFARGESAGEKLGEIGPDAKLITFGIGDRGRIGSGGRGPVLVGMLPPPPRPPFTLPPPPPALPPPKFWWLLPLSDELLEMLFVTVERIPQ